MKNLPVARPTVNKTPELACALRHGMQFFADRDTYALISVVGFYCNFDFETTVHAEFLAGSRFPWVKIVRVWLEKNDRFFPGVLGIRKNYPLYGLFVLCA